MLSNKRDRLNYNDGKNYMLFENIHSALQESLPEFDIRTLKPYLWRDEIKDIFLLTRGMKIFLYNRYTLNCYCWSCYVYNRIKKAGLMLDKSGRDDSGLYHFKSDITNLPELIRLSGEVKQRMGVRSNKRKRFENWLGHKIYRCEFDHSTWKAVQTKSTYGERPILKNNPQERGVTAT